MKMRIFLLAALIYFAAAATWAAEVNLLNRGCVLSGSGFSAEAKGWKLETFHYYDRLADGKKHTCWKAFDSRGPHYIYAKWRTPVKFNRIAWTGRNFAKLAVNVWCNGKYELLKELEGAKGEADLPLAIGIDAPEKNVFHVLYADGKIKKYNLERPGSCRRIISFLFTVHRWKPDLFQRLIEQAQILDGQSAR